MEKSPYFKASDVMAYAIAVANREGVGELARQLRLSQPDTLTFKMRAVSERRKDNRDEDIRVIKKAFTSGMGSLKRRSTLALCTQTRAILEERQRLIARHPRRR
jgi:hypothetical protein